ncbi:MAG: cell envelope integrity protein TolA [Anaplasma sp.]
MFIRIVREVLLSNVHVVLSILLHVAVGAVYLAGAFAERSGAQHGSSNPMVVLSPLPEKRLEEASPLEEQSIAQEHDAEHVSLQERIERIAGQIAEENNGQVVEEVQKPVQGIPKPPSRKRSTEERQAAQRAFSAEAPVGDKPQPGSPEEELAGILQVVRSEARRERDTDRRDPALKIASAIKSRFVECWTVPAGAKDVDDMVVKVSLVLAPSGKVIRANVMDKRMYNRDPFFRAMADSALRAVYKCSPLSGLRANSYNLWREIVLTFNPKPMVSRKQTEGGDKASAA